MIPQVVWHRGLGGFIRISRWSVAWHNNSVRGYVPLSERYGTTKTWRLGGFSLRRHGGSR